MGNLLPLSSFSRELTVSDVPHWYCACLVKEPETTEFLPFPSRFLCNSRLHTPPSLPKTVASFFCCITLVVFFFYLSFSRVVLLKCQHEVMKVRQLIRMHLHYSNYIYIYLYTHTHTLSFDRITFEQVSLSVNRKHILYINISWLNRGSIT